MHSRSIIILTLIATLMAGCEVEFSPNAQWKETPVVYCVLDQDDDTTWVRVEKCFLGEGSIYQFGAIPDSTNYPPGSISVTLLAYRWSQPQGSVTLQYALRPRQEGDFPGGMQPVYFTDQPLNENFMYKIEVRRTSDNSLLAWTDSIPLIRQTEERVFTKPNLFDQFKFLNYNQDVASCHLEWNLLENARRYQPFVRFYYGELGDTHYVDLMCATVNSGNNGGRLATYYPRSAFLNGIKEALKDDPNPKQYLKYVDIYLTACDEDLNVYLTSVHSGTSIDQASDTYTNIHGGMGIFGARRTQLHKTVQADSSLIAPDGLHYLLKGLNVGFE